MAAASWEEKPRSCREDRAFEPMGQRPSKPPRRRTNVREKPEGRGFFAKTRRLARQERPEEWGLGFAMGFRAEVRAFSPTGFEPRLGGE